MTASVAVTIGNFDGVHRGHVALVSAARREVGPEGRVVVLTFDPHPITILRPEVTPSRLSSLQQRSRWLTAAGADEVVQLEPTRHLLGQEPQAFVADIVARFRPTVIVEGPDFRFGRGRSGSLLTLRELEQRFHYRTVVIDPVKVGLLNRQLVVASSTMVRWMVGLGRLGDAARLLGRPYELVGEVKSGDQRGRSLGIPTANVDTTEYALPGDGIYYGRAQRPDGSEFAAAISVGTKPTFGARPRTLEVHLLGYEGDLQEYGWRLRVEIAGWLRDQIRYEEVDVLLAQIRRDLRRAEELASW